MNKGLESIYKMNTNKALLRMSIPIFVELLLQLLVGNIDQIMVSYYSQESVAAIVNGNQIMNLIIIVLNMISMATTVLMTQYLGAKDQKNVSRICMISLGMVMVISVVLTVIVLLSERGIYRALNVPDSIFEETCAYLAIVASFILVQGIYLNFAAILRAHTFMKEVMYVSIIMNVLNICGNAVLINGLFGAPRLGIIGAAISTVFSKTIGLAMMIWLFRKKVHIPLKKEYVLPFPGKLLGKLCKLAFPSGLESFSYQMAQMCILSIINIFGTRVTATKGYCSILSNFAYVYAIAIAQATQIVLGYLLGARLTQEIQKRVWSTLKIAICVCEGITLLLFLSSNVVMRVFTSDPEVLALAKQIFMVEFLLEIGRAINICMTRALIAVGDVKTPMIAGIGGHWLIGFAFAYLFGIVLDMGLVGVWLAMAMDECIRGLIYVVQFKRGKWKQRIGN